MWGTHAQKPKNNPYTQHEITIIYMHVHMRDTQFTFISTPLSIERVRQGSVLSPTLSNRIMDPLLWKMKIRILPSIYGLFLGAFGHPDDVRTLSTNKSDSHRFNSVNLFVALGKCCLGDTCNQYGCSWLISSACRRSSKMFRSVVVSSPEILWQAKSNFKPRNWLVHLPSLS